MGSKATQADQIVGGRHQIARQVREGEPPIACAAEPAHGFHPPEDLFYSFANPLAHGIAGVAGRPPIDGAAAFPPGVLSDVRGDASHPLIGHARGRVVVLSLPQVLG